MIKNNVRKVLIMLMLLAFSIFSFGCTKKDDSENSKVQIPDNVIINDLKGKPVEFTEFKNMYINALGNFIRYNKIKTEDELKQFLSIEISPGVTQEDYIRQLILERIINLHLVKDYMQEKGHVISDDKVNETFKMVKESVEKFSPETLEYNKLNGITDEIIRADIEDLEYMNKFGQDTYENVKKEYENDAAKLENTAIRVEASHILLPTEEEAKVALERIKKGEDFALVAKELSADKVSGENGGELGYFGRGTMVKEFSDAAFSMNVGDVSEPVKSQFGYHIIKLTGKETYADIKAKNSDENDLKMMFDQILDMEVEARMGQKIKELSSDLKLDINKTILHQKMEIKMPQAETPKEEEKKETQDNSNSKQENSENKKNE